jgi:Uma2 family endonuclease
MAQATARKKHASIKNLADLIERLGDIPLERIRFHPAPGTATERDVIAAWSGVDRRLCELVDGVLVEKPVATFEAIVAGLLVHYFWTYLDNHDVGIAIPGDGMVRLWRGLVRIPDAAVYLWERFPGGIVPKDPIASVVPDIAVEVLSESNTPKEMERKLREYFEAGAQMVWLIDPKTETAQVYTSPSDKIEVAKSGSLDGGAVLPGFSVRLRKLFSRRGPKKGRS